MSQPELVIPVADLERGPKHAEFVLSEAWLGAALADTEAKPAAPGRLEVTLSKNGAEVLVRGEVQAELTMPCVVTLDPVPVHIQTPLMLILSPRAPAPVVPLARRARARESSQSGPAPGERGAAPGRSAREAAPREGRVTRPKSVGKGDSRWEETPILTEEEAGRDTYDGHEVVLDGFVREFLILELPMYPRRSDLPTGDSPANPPLPASDQSEGERPIDPRLSPLAELKQRLLQVKKE
jgi:uncharacterized metal-binding protein YceD (DUF177 family)